MVVETLPGMVGIRNSTRSWEDMIVMSTVEWEAMRYQLQQNPARATGTETFELDPLNDSRIVQTGFADHVEWVYCLGSITSQPLVLSWPELMAAVIGIAVYDELRVTAATEAALIELVTQSQHLQHMSSRIPHLLESTPAMA